MRGEPLAVRRKGKSGNGAFVPGADFRLVLGVSRLSACRVGKDDFTGSSSITVARDRQLPLVGRSGMA